MLKQNNNKTKKNFKFKSAKENFNIFVYNNQRLLETDKIQSKQKMVTLESIKVSFAIFWTLFYLIVAIILMYFTISANNKESNFPAFLGTFSLLFFICSLFYNISKYSKRNNYKDVALMSLQMKINKYIQYDTPLEPILNKENQQNLVEDVKKNVSTSKLVEKISPIKRQLDFNNLTKDKIIQILKLSNIDFSSKETVDQLALKVNDNDNNISWNKISKELLKEILDLNGITYKLNISKEDMVKLLAN